MRENWRESDLSILGRGANGVKPDQKQHLLKTLPVHTSSIAIGVDSKQVTSARQGAYRSVWLNLSRRRQIASVMRGLHAYAIFATDIVADADVKCVDFLYTFAKILNDSSNNSVRRFVVAVISWRFSFWERGGFCVLTEAKAHPNGQTLKIKPSNHIE